MLLRDCGDGTVLAIGQPSHSWLAGQLGRAWGNKEFGEVSPREAVCLAAEQHDCGMAMSDLTPGFNSDTGLPVTFMEMPLQEHIALWSEAPRRLLMTNQYASLLVSLHGTALYELRNLDGLPEADAELIRTFLRELKRFQEELLESLRSHPATATDSTADAVQRNRQLLWTWDNLSLALCLPNWPRSVENVPSAVPSQDVAVELVQLDDAARRFTVEPWPFRSDHVRLYCEGRSLSKRFKDENEMRLALAKAPSEPLVFELMSVHSLREPSLNLS